MACGPRGLRFILGCVMRDFVGFEELLSALRGEMFRPLLERFSRIEVIREPKRDGHPHEAVQSLPIRMT